MTRDWLREQIISLTEERDNARQAVNRTKADMEAAKKLLDEAYGRLDRIDVCISGLRTALKEMEGE